MNKTREQLLSEYIETQNRLNLVSKELDKFDRDNKFSIAQTYLNRCFKEVNDNENYVRCLYVYAIDEDCKLQTIDVDYNTTLDIYFEIRYYDMFDPQSRDDKNWIEIDREEFIQHYKSVQSLITQKLINI